MSGLVPADALEAGQIAFDVRAKALWEVVPCGALCGLHRRLDETHLRPTIDPADSGIPQPCQNSPACRITGASRRSRTVIHVAIDDGLIDRLGFDVDAGAEPHQRHQSI